MTGSAWETLQARQARSPILTRILKRPDGPNTMLLNRRRARAQAHSSGRRLAYILFEALGVDFADHREIMLICVTRQISAERGQQR